MKDDSSKWKDNFCAQDLKFQVKINRFAKRTRQISFLDMRLFLAAHNKEDARLFLASRNMVVTKLFLASRGVEVQPAILKKSSAMAIANRYSLR